VPLFVLVFAQPEIASQRARHGDAGALIYCLITNETRNREDPIIYPRTSASSAPLGHERWTCAAVKLAVLNKFMRIVKGQLYWCACRVECLRCGRSGFVHAAVGCWTASVLFHLVSSQRVLMRPSTGIAREHFFKSLIIFYRFYNSLGNLISQDCIPYKVFED
jgi:hypothetical protein